MCVFGLALQLMQPQGGSLSPPLSSAAFTSPPPTKRRFDGGSGAQTPAGFPTVHSTPLMSVLSPVPPGTTFHVHTPGGDMASPFTPPTKRPGLLHHDDPFAPSWSIPRPPATSHWSHAEQPYPSGAGASPRAPSAFAGAGLDVSATSPARDRSTSSPLSRREPPSPAGFAAIEAAFVAKYGGVRASSGSPGLGTSPASLGRGGPVVPPRTPPRLPLASPQRALPVPLPSSVSAESPSRRGAAGLSGNGMPWLQHHVGSRHNMPHADTAAVAGATRRVGSGTGGDGTRGIVTTSNGVADVTDAPVARVGVTWTDRVTPGVHGNYDAREAVLDTLRGDSDDDHWMRLRVSLRLFPPPQPVVGYSCSLAPR